MSSLSYGQIVINTIAGGGTNTAWTNGSTATDIELFANPAGVARDYSGNTYFCSSSEDAVYKINSAGEIHLVAGGNGAGSNGDGGLATSAQLDFPYGVAVSSSGEVFISEFGGARIRKVDASGIITTVAGNGINGFSGDGGSATACQLSNPRDISVDFSGQIYICDFGNNRIRKVNSAGIISTVAGNGSLSSSTVPSYYDSGSALTKEIEPYGIDVDQSGNIYIAMSSSLSWDIILKVDPTGNISRIAGSFPGGAYSGDNGPAINAQLNQPRDVWASPDGQFYITDASNHAIRKITSTGLITTVAGTAPTAGNNGDGLASATALDIPFGIHGVTSSEIFFSDRNNKLIRKYFNCNAGDQPTISIDQNDICEGDQVTLTVDAGNLNDATDWQWYIDGCGITSIGSGASLNHTPSSSGSILYYARSEGGCTLGSACDSISLNVHAIPNATISISGNTLTTGFGDQIEWYLNGSLISGETSPTLNISTDGDYQAIVSNNGGMCSDTSTIFTVAGLGIESSDVGITLYPNPSISNVTIKAENGETIFFTVTNQLGEIIESTFFNELTEIKTDHWETGVYFFHISSEETNQTIKLIKK